MQTNSLYPFTAVVGQEQAKKALLIALVNPKAGGLLIGGRKGTAKSVLARSTKELIGSKQFIDLPLNVTEDMLFGSIDIEYAVSKGQKRFAPGILARANENILYIDEVNLPRQELLLAILDANAAGLNQVERDGISFTHPVHLTVLATMNPEEGDIRPQLLDRFGLSVVVTGEHDPLQRVEVIKRRLAYENDAESFIAGYKEAQEELAEKIIAAGKLLPEVTIDDKLLETVAKLSVELGVDGHRADITVIKTALTLAAFNGRKQANLDDLKEAAKLVLPHRMRRRPFEEGELDWNKVESFLAAEA